MKPAYDVLERDWQRQVIDVANLFHYDHYHTYRSKKSPSGFPDLVLVGRRTIFAELKREKGVVSPAQAEWIGKLAAAGSEVYVLRPRHFDAFAEVLQARGPIAVWTADQVEARHALLLELDTHLPKEKAA